MVFNAAFYYTPVEDRTYYVITRSGGGGGGGGGGGAASGSLSGAFSKTILAMVMKFCEWIDLIKGECSAHEP